MSGLRRAYCPHCHYATKPYLLPDLVARDLAEHVTAKHPGKPVPR